MIYSLNGERCTSSSRVLIEESIYDKFTQRLAERARNIKVGDPLDPATEIGPLIHPKHLEKVRSYFSLAKEEGATVAAGGGDFGGQLRQRHALYGRNEHHAHRSGGDFRPPSSPRFLLKTRRRL